MAIYLEGISHAYAVCVQVWIQVIYSVITPVIQSVWFWLLYIQGVGIYKKMLESKFSHLTCGHWHLWLATRQYQPPGYTHPLVIPNPGLTHPLDIHTPTQKWLGTGIPTPRMDLVPEIPTLPPLWTDKHLWRCYLPTTSLAGSSYPTSKQMFDLDHSTTEIGKQFQPLNLRRSIYYTGASMWNSFTPWYFEIFSKLFQERLLVWVSP